MEEKLIIDFFAEEKNHWWHIAKRLLIRQFVKGDNLDILVAGVGGGMICSELKAAGHNVVGIDISPVACGHVSKKFAIPVVNGDLENDLPFRKESLDLIIAADVLEHLDNDRHFLSQAASCLRTKGAIIVTVPAYPNIWSLWDKRLHHRRRYLLSAIKQQLVETGFSIEKASYCHMLLYPLAYFYRRVLIKFRSQNLKDSEFFASSNKITLGFASFYYSLERALLKVFNLPFGLSIFAIGVKHG